MNYLLILFLYDSSTFSPIILSDGRLVTSENCLISIYKCNKKQKKWIKEINENKEPYHSFIELPNNRLVSVCGRYIKIWNILPNELKLITIKEEYNAPIYKIINLNNNKFAIASNNKTVKIYNSEKPYNLIEKLIHIANVNNMLFIKSKEMLLTNYYEKNMNSLLNLMKGGLVFWNLQTYQQEHMIDNVFTSGKIGSMIELPEHRIAVSTEQYPFYIMIINIDSFKIVKQIKSNECSSLCLINDSFVYVYSGKLIQISTSDYSRSKVNIVEGLNGRECILLVNGGKHLLIPNNSKGFDILTICFSKNQ